MPLPLINPARKELGGKTYLIGKWPAVAGREIIAGYPLTAIPKMAEYKANEAVMLKLMAYVAIELEPGVEPLRLTTQSLIDNHVPDWEDLARLEFAAIEYNCSFFRDGRVSALLAGSAQTVKSWISQMLTGSLGRSLGQVLQRGETSAKRSRSKKP